MIFARWSNNSCTANNFSSRVVSTHLIMNPGVGPPLSCSGPTSGFKETSLLDRWPAERRFLLQSNCDPQSEHLSFISGNEPPVLPATMQLLRMILLGALSLLFLSD